MKRCCLHARRPPPKCKMINVKKFCGVHVFALLCCICACSSQSITIFEYKNNDGSTSCTRGLLYDYDMYTLKAKVDCKNENTVTKMFFRYRTKQDISFTYLCDVDLSRSLHISNPCSFAISTVDNRVYDIDVTVKASRLLDGATIHGVVVAQNNDMFKSNDVTLPELYDITSSTGHLIVNGEEFPTEQLNDVISVSFRELTIMFLCECEAVPCLIEISADDSELVAQRKGYVVYKRTFENSTQINVTIRHAACRLDGEFNILQFRVRIDFPLGVTERKTNCSGDSTITVLLCVIGFLMLAVIAMGVTLGICHKEKRKLKSSRTPSIMVHAISDPDATDARITALRSQMSSNDANDDEKEHQVPVKGPSKAKHKSQSKRIDCKLRLPLLEVNSQPTNEDDVTQVNSNLATQQMDWPTTTIN